MIFAMKNKKITFLLPFLFSQIKNLLSLIKYTLLFNSFPAIYSQTNKVTNFTVKNRTCIILIKYITSALHRA